MKALALSQFQNINLTSLGLLIFFTYFCGVVLWSYRKGSKQSYQRLQNIPFEDGE